MQQGHTDSLDCGFQVNGSFQDTFRWVRSKTIPESLTEAKAELTVYDLPKYEGVWYEDRREWIARIIQGTCLKQLPAYHAESPAEVEVLYQKFRDAGYEGAMVKTMDGLYQPGKRPVDWMKLKPEEDADGIFQHAIEAISDTDDPAKGLYVGKPLGRAAAVAVAIPIYSEDSVVIGHDWAQPHGIPHDLGREIWEHPEKFKGMWVEFSYMERDRQGGYRHPVFRRFREAKA